MGMVDLAAGVAVQQEQQEQCSAAGSAPAVVASAIAGPLAPCLARLGVAVGNQRVAGVVRLMAVVEVMVIVQEET